MLIKFFTEKRNPHLGLHEAIGNTFGLFEFEWIILGNHIDVKDQNIKANLNFLISITFEMV